MAISDFKNISKDDILAALGLEAKHSMGDHMLSGLLMMGAGIAIGVGIGMLLAPKSGNELRSDLADQYRKTVGKAHDAMSDETPSTSSTTSRSGTTAGSSSYGSNPA